MKIYTKYEINYKSFFSMVTVNKILVTINFPYLSFFKNYNFFLFLKYIIMNILNIENAIKNDGEIS